MFALCSSPPCSVPHVEYITGSSALWFLLVSAMEGMEGGEWGQYIYSCGSFTAGLLPSGWIPALKVITHIRHPLHRDLAFSGYRSPCLSLCPFRPRRDDDTHWCWPGAPYPLLQFCYIFSHSCVNWSFIKPSLYYPNLRVLSPPGVLMGVGTSVRYVQLLYHPADEEMEKQKG